MLWNQLPWSKGKDRWYSVFFLLSTNDMNRSKPQMSSSRFCLCSQSPIYTHSYMKDTRVVSEKEPFIQQCFYSNVFKGESKERIDWESAEGDRGSNEDNMYKIFFFFNFYIFSSKKCSEWESTLSKSLVTACIFRWWAFTATVLLIGEEHRDRTALTFFSCSSSVEFLHQKSSA